MELVMDDKSKIGDCYYDSGKIYESIDPYMEAIDICNQHIQKEETPCLLWDMQNLQGRVRDSCQALGDIEAVNHWLNLRMDTIARIVTHYPDSEEAMRVQRG